MKNCKSSLIFSVVLVAALYLQAFTSTKMKVHRVIKLKRKGNEFECYMSGEMEGTSGKMEGMVQVAQAQKEAFQVKVINMNLSQAGSDQKP